MKLLSIFAVILALSLSAFAAGGACPTVAAYVDITNPAGSPVTLSAGYGLTSCFYFSKALGSDSNNGTSEATPQAHLPFMPSYTGSINIVSQGAGVGYILRGGDLWTASDFPMISVNAAGNGVSGTSSNHIYVGVDPGWFVGAVWSRPIFDCQNTQCGVNRTINGINFGNNAMFQIALSSFWIVDNIEWTGDLSDTSAQKTIQNGNGGGTADHNTFLQHYSHGWGHTANSWASGNDNCYSDSTTTHSAWLLNICDGADTTKDMRSAFRVGGDTLAFNIAQFTYEGSHGRVTDIHGNNFCHFILDGHPGGGDHANAIVNAQPTGVTTLLLYNNVLCDDSLAAGMENLWWCGAGTGNCTGVTTYAANNVVFDFGRQIDVGDHNPSSGGTFNWYNGTVKVTAAACIGNGETPPRSTVNYENMHCIQTNAGGSFCNSTGVTCSNLGNNLLQTAAQANSNISPNFDQYNDTQTYAFSPVASTNSTVGAGANLTSVCGSVPALCKDTTYATYDTVNHKVVLRTVVNRPASGAWDIGAYQFIAPATQRYVATTGTDSGACLVGAPCATITYASNQTNPGDTVHVAAGTYNQDVSMSHAGLAGFPITYVSDTQYAAHIIGSADAIWSNTGAYVAIQNFEISAANSTPRTGILTYGHDNIVKGNLVHDIVAQPGWSGNGGSGISPNNNGSGTKSDNTIVDSNIIYNIGLGAPSGTNVVEGIYVNGSLNNLVENNLVFAVHGGWCVQQWHTGVGQMTVINNTLFGCRGGIVLGSGDNANPSDFNVISNNIIYQNNWDGGNFGIYECCSSSNNGVGTHQTYTNNLFFQNSPSNWSTAWSGDSPVNSVISDPLFVNNTGDISGNYQLRSTSPALNAGTSANAPNHDLLGNTRPFGGGFDIGAYETQLFPAVNLNPNPLAFGTVIVGSSSAPSNVTLTNTGSADLHITTVALQTGTQFSKGTDNCAGQTIAASGTCTVAVIFSPTSVGAKSDNLLFTDDAPGSPQAGALTGTGIAQVVTPTFAPPAGTYSSPQNVTISTITGGATICYRTDGVNPSSSAPGTCASGSTTYSGPVAVSSSLTLKAIGTLAGFADSAVGSAVYVISISALAPTVVMF